MKCEYLWKVFSEPDSKLIELPCSQLAIGIKQNVESCASKFDKLLLCPSISILYISRLKGKNFIENDECNNILRSAFSFFFIENRQWNQGRSFLRLLSPQVLFFRKNGPIFIFSCHHENQTAEKVLLCQEEQNRLLKEFHQIAQKEENHQKQHPLNCICDSPVSTGCKVANFLKLDLTDCTKNEVRTVAKCTPIVELATEEIMGFEKDDPPKNMRIQEFLKTNYSFRECCFDW